MSTNCHTVNRLSLKKISNCCTRFIRRRFGFQRAKPILIESEKSTSFLNWSNLVLKWKSFIRKPKKLHLRCKRVKLKQQMLHALWEAQNRTQTSSFKPRQWHVDYHGIYLRSDQKWTFSEIALWPIVHFVTVIIFHDERSFWCLISKNVTSRWIWQHLTLKAIKFGPQCSW